MSRNGKEGRATVSQVMEAGSPLGMGGQPRRRRRTLKATPGEVGQKAQRQVVALSALW